MIKYWQSYRHVIVDENEKVEIGRDEWVESVTFMQEDNKYLLIIGENEGAGAIEVED